MRDEARYFQTLSQEELWQRYCGFFYLDVDRFLTIQEKLLLDEIERVADNVIAKKIMNNSKPKSIEEFRKTVPLTSYEDYEPYLKDKTDEYLAEKPFDWCHSAGRGGYFKWIPHSHESLEKTTRNFTAVFILACAQYEGMINASPGFRILSIVPPRPYSSGWLLHLLEDRLSCNVIPPTEEASDMSFEERLESSVHIALRDGADTAFALSSILVKMGETFAGKTKSVKLSRSMMHPNIAFRLLNAYFSAKKAGRQILPKDLWQLKGIATAGMDTAIYKKDIMRYWGMDPYEFYAASDSGFLAMQAWNKKGMTFLPDSVFLEFIPHDEKSENETDNNKLPSTVLLNELEPGKLYEVVITNFYGMPFMRYRMRDLIKVTALSDDETGIKLPQIVFQRRLGETINLAGLTALDEKTIWQAIANTGLKYNDWVACKEYVGDKSLLRIYIEMNEDEEVANVEKAIDKQLKEIDLDYRDVDFYLGLQPVRVGILSRGTFDRYVNEKQEQGYDLAHLKPRRINATDADIERLLNFSKVK